MALYETIEHLNALTVAISKDLLKVHRGNRTAAQRVRVNTIRLSKVGKRFRQESLHVEKRETARLKKRRKKR